MSYRSQLFSIACSCSVLACGSSPLPSTSADLDTYPIGPHRNPGIFRSTGQQFYISTGCSPHSTSIELNVHQADVSVRFSEMTGTARMLTLDLNSHLIAELLSEFSPAGRLQTHSQNLSPPRRGGARDTYLTAFKDMRSGVQTLQKGNLCFPGVFYLQDLADYLDHSFAVEANQ